MIKRITYYGLFVLLFCLQTIAQAQDSDYDGDSLECNQAYTKFNDAFENNDFPVAFVGLRNCIGMCPKANINLYINGAKVISGLIKAEYIESRKQELIDTLLFLYDTRIAHFSQEGKVLGYKAEDMLIYQPNKLDEIYELLGKSVSLEGKKSRGGVLSAYFKIATEKYKKRQILKEEAIEVYGTSRLYIDANLAKDSTDKYYKKAKIEVDELYAKEFKLDCSALSALYGSMYESNSTSVLFLRKLESILVARNCTNSDLYKLVETSLIELDPTSESLERIAKEYLLQNDLPKGIETYKKAIAKETDADKKAEMYYNLAIATKVNHALSIMFCNSAIQTSASYARPYLLMSQLYAKGSGRCGSGDAKRAFIQKTMYWAATDKCETAKNVDPKLTKEADALIAEYQLKYPTQEDIDKEGLKVGDSYAINCWLTTVTTVRAKKVVEQPKVEETKK